MYVCISIYTHYTYIAYYTYDVYYTVSIKGGLSIHSFPMIFFPSQQKIDGLQSIKNHLPRIDKWLDSYPLVNIQKTMERSTIFHGEID